MYVETGRDGEQTSFAYLGSSSCATVRVVKGGRAWRVRVDGRLVRSLTLPMAGPVLEAETYETGTHDSYTFTR